MNESLVDLSSQRECSVRYGVGWVVLEEERKNGAADGLSAGVLALVYYFFNDMVESEISEQVVSHSSSHHLQKQSEIVTRSHLRGDAQDRVEESLDFFE